MIMNLPTTVEVKCDCKIPFHLELVAYLEQLFTNPNSETNMQQALKINQLGMALQRRMVFIKITNPIKGIRIRPKLLKNVKLLFNKDVVGTIKGARNEITLILV